MGKIFFTSDTHFGHDRQFIWGPRGFESVWKMNGAIVENWNKTVNTEDDVYLLGDVMLGDNEYGLTCLKQLKGNIHIVRGNHDTNTRMELYNKCWNVVEITEGQFFKYKDYHFYLSHYPTITSNLEKSPNPKEHMLNLYGHTHSKDKFYNDIPFMYNVAVDAHNCYPVEIEQIIIDIKEKVKECTKYL